MQTIHHICDNCDSDFTVKYDEEYVEDSPQFCPFCGEFLIDFEKIEDEDD
jgi:DNA replicative helicase MCM subunit Mcm2 (Cdc46/Mcm family)